MKPWINQWALPQMYAGVEGRGADDAAYETGVVTELCKVSDQSYTGGSADIYKCFDQVQRPLIYKLLEQAGMPAGILSAYKRYMDQVLVHNAVAGGLGKGV